MKPKPKSPRLDGSGLLLLLADIRAAVGDPTGKLMQDELVERCRKIAHSADWNRRRVDMLSRMQKHMRDPERTLVCDIIANCQLLPDRDGKRYGFATTGTEHCQAQPHGCNTMNDVARVMDHHIEPAPRMLRTGQSRT